MNKDSPEINEIPDLENQNFNKKFRRTNDAVQYQVFVSILKAYEKTINLLKYTLIIIVIAIIFVYNSFSNDTTREDYQILLLNDIILKLDDLKKNQIGTNTNQIDKTKLLERIINISHNTKQCGACHNENNNIKVYTGWNFTDFKNYLKKSGLLFLNKKYQNLTEVIGLLISCK